MELFGVNVVDMRSDVGCPCCDPLCPGRMADSDTAHMPLDARVMLLQFNSNIETNIGEIFREKTNIIR